MYLKNSREAISRIAIAVIIIVIVIIGAVGAVIAFTGGTTTTSSTQPTTSSVISSTTSTSPATTSSSSSSSLLSSSLLSSSSSSSSAPGLRSTVIIGTTDPVANLDPATAVGYFADNLINNIGSGLVAYPPNSTSVVPDIATSWTITDNGTTYTFQLTNGVKFSNGDPLTAQTIIESWRRVNAINGPPAFLLQSYINLTDPKSLSAPSNNILVVHLMAPFSPFLGVLALSGPPADPVDTKVVNLTGAFSGAFVGTGPYMVTKWTTGVEMDLSANPNYYGTAPLTKNIVIKFFSDASTLALAVQSKSVDIAYRSLNPADVNSMMSNPSLSVLQGPGAVMRYIAFNNKIAPFNNTLVRQALTYAINRTTIINSVFLNTVSPAYSLVPSGVFGHVDIYKTLYGADGNLTKAKQLLTQLGYSTTNKLQMDLWYTPSHYGTTEQSVVTVLSQEFQATGMISVTLHSAEYSSYTSLYAGKVNLPVLMLGWFPDYIDADDYVSVMYNSHIDPYTGTFYNNTLVDKLLGQEAAITDTAQRLPILQQIQNITAQADPSVPLWQEKQIAVTQTYVSGVVLDISQLFRFSLVQATQS